MEENKKVRNLNGIDPEAWNQFSYWAKRLGYKQAEFFEEMLRFYFEKNKDEIERKSNTLEIKVKTTSKEQLSPLLLADIKKIEEELPTATSEQMERRSKGLAMTYIDNPNYSRQDRLLAESWVVKLDELKKQKKEARA